MDRNLFLAIILSTIILIGFYTIFPPEAPIQESAVTPSPATQTDTKKVEPQTKKISETRAPLSPQTEAKLIATPAEEVKGESISIETPLYVAKLNTKGGILESLKLNNYQYAYTPPFDVKKWIISLFTGGNGKPDQYSPDRMVEMLGDTNPDNLPWKFTAESEKDLYHFQSNLSSVKLENGDKKLRLLAKTASGLEVEKLVTFHAASYIINIENRVLNRSGADVIITPRMNFGAGNEALPHGPRTMPKQGVAYIDDDIETYDEGDIEEKPLTFNEFTWIGVMDNYFIHAVQPQDTKSTARFTAMASKMQESEIKIPRLGFEEPSLKLQTGREYSQKYKVFIGPKLSNEMDKFDPTLYQSLDLLFGDLAFPLLALLRWINQYVFNWGVSIILLTLIVRIAMFPLALKSMKSMKKMGKLGPKMKKLKEKYKEDKERLNKETMLMYQKNKVNPVGGCLPMLVQIPIFIALYSALLPAIELRHSPFFLWYQDLSAADHTLILPILMGVSMYFQQGLNPTPAMDPAQAKMLKWMPVIMTFFFLDFPSGLVLYWVISNLISIVQQLLFNRITIPEVID